MVSVYSYFYVWISSPITSLRLAATPQFPTQVNSPPEKIFYPSSVTLQWRLQLLHTDHPHDWSYGSAWDLSMKDTSPRGLGPWGNPPSSWQGLCTIHAAGIQAHSSIKSSFISVMVQGLFTFTTCFIFFLDKGQGLDFFFSFPPNLFSLYGRTGTSS